MPHCCHPKHRSEIADETHAVWDKFIELFFLVAMLVQTLLSTTELCLIIGLWLENSVCWLWSIKTSPLRRSAPLPLTLQSIHLIIYPTRRHCPWNSRAVVPAVVSVGASHCEKQTPGILYVEWEPVRLQANFPAALARRRDVSAMHSWSGRAGAHR